MSRALSEEIISSVQELIGYLSGFEEGTEPYNYVLKYFITKIKKSDTMYFLNKRDVDQSIDSMSEKFCFHGFFLQAEALKSAYKTYIPENLQKSDTTSRLNMVKLLLCMSETPTKNFLENPQEFLAQIVEEEEEINWTDYLNEGIDTWNPNFEETSDEESLVDIHENKDADLADSSDSNSLVFPVIKSSEKICTTDLKTSREELLATIQHSWYNQEKFFITPESNWSEANMGILWEEYLREQVKGLVLLKTPSFISEYKVIREILWQLWCPHTSSSLELSRNDIRPRRDVTLASVRCHAFYNFMNEFIPYIELLDHFREFEKSLETGLNQDDASICRTYLSYCNCLNNYIAPVYKKLCKVEDEVRNQETTYTLLQLANELNYIFKPLKILKEIHEEVILDRRSNSPLTCATMLITKLHESLHFTTNKIEQDIKVTLFLESIYHYFGLVDSWLIKDDLADYTKEFVIEKKSNTVSSNLNFDVRTDIGNHCISNSFLNIFIERVIKIGRNINFLRLLGKYDVIGDCQESIYNEFLNKVLKKLEAFYNVTIEEKCSPGKADLDINISPSQQSFIFPVVGTDVCKYNPEMEKLENLIDTKDGFLMTAFSDFFVKKPVIEEKEKISLHQRISDITKNLFPKTNFFENIFLEILNDRFTISGLMVKNLLIEEHLLEKQFQFLRHLYLFFDDMIFPFYRRLFEKTETSNKNWANDIWLTSHLQDIFMDIFPEFCEKCSVQVNDGWSLCNDSLSACSLLNINYEIPWPLNIIISQDQIEMYKEIFQFLIKLKWALHTLNHLAFLDLESKDKPTEKHNRTFKATNHKNRITAKLIRLKFCLINILNSLQHFIFGFVFSKNVLKFELNFEKAYDLNSLIESHSGFINYVSSHVTELKYCMIEKDKHNNVLNCVKLLKLMWSNQTYATVERINDCNQLYEKFSSDISPIIFPIYIYDY